MLRNRIYTIGLAAILSSLTINDGHCYEISAEAIQQHIEVLAHDSLEGREVGEPGELKAAMYIESVFKQAGLQPGGENGGYLQSFEFTKSIDFGPTNRLTINGQALELTTEFEQLNQEILELSSEWLSEMQQAFTMPDFEAPIAKKMKEKGQKAKDLKEEIINQMRIELKLD